MANSIIKSNPEYQTALSAYLKSTTSTQYLSFKQGIFATKDREFCAGTRFRAKPREHEVGWQVWGPDGKPETLSMGFIHEGYIAPSRNDMRYLDRSLWDVSQLDNKPRDPVQPVDRMPLISEDGIRYLYSTSSWGGRVGLGLLEKEVLRDGGERDPIIEIGVDRVKNSFGGFNFQPRFHPVDWVCDTPPVPVALPVKKSTSEIVQDEIPGEPKAEAGGGKAPPKNRKPAPADPNDDYPSNLK